MIEEKLDTLTKEIIKLREAIEKGGVGGAAKGGDAKKPDAKKPDAKKPKYSVEQVKAKVLEVKEKHDMDRAKKVIADTGADDLADLLTQPALFDQAYALAEEALAEEGEDDSGL